MKVNGVSSTTTTATASIKKVEDKNSKVESQKKVQLVLLRKQLMIQVTRL